MTKPLKALPVSISLNFIFIALLSGCIGEGHVFVITPLNIGDSFLYKVKIVHIQRHLSNEEKRYINGSIFSSVNGSKTIVDGFGIERNVIEFYTRMDYSYPNSNVTTQSWEYLDIDSGFPVKSISSFQNTSYEIYPSPKFYKVLSKNPFANYAIIGAFSYSPADLCKIFGGRTIKKGEKGLIDILGEKIRWEALDEETVADYDCIKVHFTSKFSHTYKFGNQSQELDATFDYTLWLSDNFPQLIKTKVIVNIVMPQMSTKSIFSSTIIDFNRGHKTINWGSKEPASPERNVYGDFIKWTFAPLTGNKSTNISFAIEDAVNYLKAMNLSYLNSHPDARVLIATYIEKKKQWRFILGDETKEGYVIDLSFENNSIEVKNSREMNLPISVSLPKEMEILSLSGCEDVARHYIHLEKDYLISFGINSSLFTKMGGLGGLKLGPAVVVFDSIYSPLYIISTDKDSSVLDAETGQVILVVRSLH